MESLNVWFTGKDQVETRREAVKEPGPGEVVLKARTSLISTGTEGICLGRLFEPGSHWDDWVKYPFGPGYSMIAEVAAAGADVSMAQVGERVAVRMHHRQYSVMSEKNVFPVPESLGDEEAAWFALASIAQTGTRSARHLLGEAVVIVGVGPLGQLAAQYARLSGAREVIAIDTAPMRLEAAKAHGATMTLQMPVEEAKAKVLDLTDGKGAEVVYDVTGNKTVLPHALPLVRKFGRLVILGDTGFPSEQSITRDVITRGLQIVGAHDTHAPRPGLEHAPWSHAAMIRLFFTYLSRGDMRTANLVTHRFGPQNAPEAYRLLRENRPQTLGVIFDWEQA